MTTYYVRAGGQGESAEARSRSFVRYMQRRERLDELVALARLLRPEGGF